MGQEIHVDSGPRAKTGKRIQLPINDRMAEIFKEIKLEKELRTPYVFTYAQGEAHLKGSEPVRKRKKPAPAVQQIKSVRTAFQSAMKRAGIEDFRFKDLRHTFASHLVMRRATIRDVQELLGHEDVSSTMRYAHLSPEHKKRAVSLLNGLTGSSSGNKSDSGKMVESLKS